MAALHRRHPLADRPLINWDLVLLMEPTTIVGAVIGTLLHQVMPPVAVAILLFLILGLVGMRTTRKGLRQLEREGGVRQLCSGHKAATSGEPKDDGAAAAEVGGFPATLSDGPPLHLSAVTTEGSGAPLPFPLPLPSESALSFLVSDDGGEGPSRPRSVRRRSRRLSSQSSMSSVEEGGWRPKSWRRRSSKEGSGLSTSSRQGSYEAGGEADAAPAPAKAMVQEESVEMGNAEEGAAVAADDEEEEAARVCASLVERERRVAPWKPALLTLCFAGVLTLESLAGRARRAPGAPRRGG